MWEGQEWVRLLIRRRLFFSYFLKLIHNVLVGHKKRPIFKFLTKSLYYFWKLSNYFIFFIAKQLEVVQRRVSEAHKNATEDKKLCNRTAFALDYLFTYKDMAMLIEALNNLNVSLRYSTNCCARMFEEGDKAVEVMI